jgi:ATP-dependent RNA helicase SUPV3L1/SUV3
LGCAASHSNCRGARRPGAAKVADEVKGLDQETRAVLRKYGVRFGAYHIYMPGLLKPAPRTLGLLLYALKHGGLSQKGLDDLPALASSGRTSIAVDPEVAKPLYRVVGYRVCGPRAVRVDILERFADLIRPALSWRPGMPGDKPAGAIDGRGFTLRAMTSLVGCSGEDFAAILRSISHGRRPAPRRKPRSVSPRGNGCRDGPDGPDRQRAADIGSRQSGARARSRRRSGSAARAGGNH